MNDLPKSEYRPYVKHKWLAHGNTATCFVCGISEKRWNRKIANSPTIEWDCLAVKRDKTKLTCK